jgi:hypothetical protein
MPLAPSSTASTGGSTMQQLSEEYRAAEGESATLGGFVDELRHRFAPERAGGGAHLTVCRRRISTEYDPCVI